MWQCLIVAPVYKSFPMTASFLICKKCTSKQQPFQVLLINIFLTFVTKGKADDIKV